MTGVHPCYDPLAMVSMCQAMWDGNAVAMYGNQEHFIIGLSKFAGQGLKHFMFG